MRTFLAIFLLSAAHSLPAQSGVSAGPESVTVQDGGLHLRGLLWRPAGQGPFAAVVFNHGLGETGIDSAQVERIAHHEIGPMFARHGYVLLYLFRRGEGLSRGQGNALGDSLAAEGRRAGPDAARILRERLLTTEQLDDVRAGIKFLRAQQNVDRLRVAIVGHSFGAMLSILAAESDSTLRAVVDFAGAAVSWDGSPTLRARLLQAAERLTVPTFFIHASNDFSVAPAEAMAAVMSRRRQPYQLKIYPPEGSSEDEGHAFVYRAPSKWESDVFAFLDSHTRGSGPPNER